MKGVAVGLIFTVASGPVSEALHGKREQPHMEASGGRDQPAEAAAWQVVINVTSTSTMSGLFFSTSA